MRGVGVRTGSTKKQDLERQLDALVKSGIPAERIYTDKNTGSTRVRPGLIALMEYAREGDVIVVYTLDRLGRTLRDTLSRVDELWERGVGVRNLADPIPVDTSMEGDAMADMAMKFLLLFADMERVYMLERAAHARALATANGKRAGVPPSWTPRGWSMRPISGTPATRSARSSPRPASRGRASTGTSRRGQRQP